MINEGDEHRKARVSTGRRAVTDRELFHTVHPTLQYLQTHGFGTHCPCRLIADEAKVFAHASIQNWRRWVC
jgi:ferredoxin-thioredoxin reductase catalytic subunit